MKPPGLSQESFVELQQIIEQASNSAQEGNSDNTLPMAPSDSDSEQVGTTSSSDKATTSMVCTSDNEHKITSEASDTVTVEITPISGGDKIIVDLAGQEHLLAMDTDELEIILTIDGEPKLQDLPIDDGEDDGNISDTATIPFEYVWKWFNTIRL